MFRLALFLTLSILAVGYAINYHVVRDKQAATAKELKRVEQELRDCRRKYSGLLYQETVRRIQVERRVAAERLPMPRVVD